MSQRLRRAVGGIVAALAIAATVTMPSAQAVADPSDQQAPTNRSEALQQYHELATQAEKVNEDYLKAKTDLKRKQHELAEADNRLARASKAERQARAQQRGLRSRVDKLADASYQGARFNQLAALLTGTSPQDFLDRAAALNVIAADKNAMLHKLAAATHRADQAQAKAATARKHATAATNAARGLMADIKHRKAALQDQISEVKQALEELSSSERQTLSDPGDQGVFIGPSDAAGVAMQAALSQRGKPYSWGAAGPDAYDCSGLTMWAYRQAGISLPHSSRAQFGMGEAVSRSNLRPGDLVFFGSPVHHVGIYVGGGKMVDAPNAGEVVKVEPMFSSSYAGARRVAG